MKKGKFICESCFRAFKLKHHLKQHLSRKIPCNLNYSINGIKKKENRTQKNQEYDVKSGLRGCEKNLPFYSIKRNQKKPYFRFGREKRPLPV